MIINYNSLAAETKNREKKRKREKNLISKWSFLFIISLHIMLCYVLLYDVMR